jgi:hypothetical protein
MRWLKQSALLFATIAWVGCASNPINGQQTPAHNSAKLESLADKDFVLEALRYVYRWHFDQSYILDADSVKTLQVWTRPLHPKLDADDRSDYAEMWIPAIKTEIQLKRAEYSVSELNLNINERSFKVTRVTRQKECTASRPNYQVHSYPLAEVKDYLFVTRTNRIPVSDALRQSASNLVADYLNRTHPEPFTEDQIGYLSPLSSVSNELWFFWETGRKLLLFSADVDLTNPVFSELSQLRMQVIDLDKDVIASTREIPGSNAFVTKDWVGRLLYNCILYGERVVRTPEQLKQLKADTARPASP